MYVKALSEAYTHPDQLHSQLPFFESVYNKTSSDTEGQNLIAFTNDFQRTLVFHGKTSACFHLEHLKSCTPDVPNNLDR